MPCTIPGSYLFFRLVHLFEYFQTFLHLLVLVNIHQYCNAPTSLCQHHRTTGFMELLYECGYPCTKFRQRTDIFIDSNP